MKDLNGFFMYGKNACHLLPNAAFLKRFVLYNTFKIKRRIFRKILKCLP